MKKIRVAIIGQGRSGRNIHGTYRKTDARLKIMATVDFLEEWRQGSQRLHGLVHLAYDLQLPAGQRSDD